MRKTLLLSAALLALLAGPAMAQRGERGRDGGGERGGRPPAAAPAAPQAAAPAPPAPQAAPTNRAEAGRQSMQREQAQRAQTGNRNRNNFAQRGDNNRNDNNRGGFNPGGGNTRPDVNRGSNDRRDFSRNDNNRPDFNRGGPGRPGFSNRPSQRNWSQYHRSFTASHRFNFRGGSYRRPAGWYYRRWSFGDFLPSLFWSSSYWINDFNYYDLPPPPPGAVWVRYGDDALLIDRFSGEIIEVEYGIFY